VIPLPNDPDVEFAAVDADLLAPTPPNLTLREAASVPLAFITAWEGLVDRAGVQARQKVLVQGAGGVGRMAIQIACAFGAEVFATDSAPKQKFIERLGATAIDHRQTTVDEYVADHTNGQGFDIVYDTVGGTTLDASFVAAKRYTGHVVSCLGWGSHSLAPLSFRGASYSGVFTLLPLITGESRAHHGKILAKAAALAEAGKLKPLLTEQRFSITDIGAAHALIQSGALGKIVVEL